MLRVCDHFADSDVGRQRQGNEDSLFVRSPIFVVADGMGGAQAGEVASSMAAESFDVALEGTEPEPELAEIIRGANERIHASSREDASRAGMGTTVTAAYVGVDAVTIAHVGDSRAYLLRGGDIARLTRDHTLVDELIARGRITEAEAETHPQRSVITRSVGPEASVAVDTETYPARGGDVFLLCSDGLTSMIRETLVHEILLDATSLRDAGRKLIAAANEAGGRDNITVVLFELESVEPRGAAASGLATAFDESEGQPTQVGDDALRATDVSGAVAEAEAATAAAATTTERPAIGPPPLKRRKRKVPPFAIILFLLAIPIVSGGLLTLRAVYFVGTDPNDGRTITVFRGVPYELPGGLKLYTRYGGSGVTVEAVPASRRATFTDHKLRTRADATELVDALELGRLEP